MSKGARALCACSGLRLGQARAAFAHGSGAVLAHVEQAHLIAPPSPSPASTACALRAAPHRRVVVAQCLIHDERKAAPHLGMPEPANLTDAVDITLHLPGNQPCAPPCPPPPVF